jgi:hypothetical protein
MLSTSTLETELRPMKPLAYLSASLLSPLPLHADSADRIVAAAPRQVGVTTVYDRWK